MWTRIPPFQRYALFQYALKFKPSPFLVSSHPTTRGLYEKQAAITRLAWMILPLNSIHISPVISTLLVYPVAITTRAWSRVHKQNTTSFYVSCRMTSRRLYFPATKVHRWIPKRHWTICDLFDSTKVNRYIEECASSKGLNTYWGVTKIIPLMNIINSAPSDGWTLHIMLWIFKM